MAIHFLQILIFHFAFKLIKINNKLANATGSTNIELYATIFLQSFTCGGTPIGPINANQANVE
ncbi:unnamed protein product [Sphenostylis stenocarpa]|uniref:Uncharacterized protein n=1 Tax=Sphenostylis stenocarpa TaxID=92480 RepID=A0AA86VQ62_9FABA|nr:unnamed protein product [Sphenostylis stenocarpa]